MTRFTVDPDELRGIARSALHLGGSLDESQLRKDGISGVAGDERVARAFEDFVSKWSDGLWRIRKHLNDLEDRLSSAAHAYAGTDAQIGAAAGGGGGGASGGDAHSSSARAGGGG